MSRRVVITGIGALTPIGNTALEFKEGLFAGKSGAAPITRFDASKFKTRFACEVKGFNPEDHLERKEARKLDAFVQYALVSAHEAYLDAGLPDSSVDPERCGVIWASGIGGLDTLLEELSQFARGDGTPRFNPFFIPKVIIDIAAGHISMRYGFRGPNYGTVSACASSAHALFDALNLIRYGRADLILCGGSEAAVNPAGIGGFNAMHALSTRNDSPETASRPFDKGRDGFVLGEGAGAMVLEEYDHAIQRGARIYCELAGAACTADAYHITAPHPEGLGARRVMEECLKDAGLKPEDIDYINVHGTSTPLGDIAETRAIKEVFGEHAYQLNISSTKSMTGHLLGAAGIVEALACLFAIQEQTIPPTINHFEDDPEIDNALNFTFHVPQKRIVRAALSNTFGFGGHNASVILKAL
ncbi:MAG: beta-ketoacyl-ACP synthase II [Flavobacteriales bacterium]|nr:beta-ketoacyl-ACP synthase II [Flavobacteriales bacterium]MCX7768581.1 beta-ketoacyl-ACP synthase II [Flavobacteriales bacterium]MDW8409765.1 beta-ketoacyl-ACP synthase II [Flavobacteriales bacterium]